MGLWGPGVPLNTIVALCFLMNENVTVCAPIPSTDKATMASLVMNLWTKRKSHLPQAILSWLNLVTMKRKVANADVIEVVCVCVCEPMSYHPATLRGYGWARGTQSDL